MTEQLPPPPLDTDVDLRDFQFMPLDVQRLRDSGFASRVKPEAFRAGLLLWCAAWHQIPSGSLPDDDIELAKLAGYGYVIEAWQALRTEALYGWILCSDGRLYHDVVVEKAREAWLSKLDNAHRRECDRLRKENKRRKEAKEEELPVPSFNQWDAARRASVIARPKAVRRNSIGNPQLSGGKKNDASPPTKPAGDIHSPEMVRLGEKHPSNGNSDRSIGKSATSNGHIYVSDGNQPPSDGIPPENALKGQGQGQGHIRDRDICNSDARACESGDGGQPQLSASPDPNEKGRDPARPHQPPGGGDWEFVGKLTVELTDTEHHARFEQAMAKYPEYAGEVNLILVENACRRIVTSGEGSWDDIDASCERFSAFVTAKGRSGPEYVHTPLKHFSDPALWRGEWKPPRNKAQRQQDDNIDESLAWLRDEEAKRGTG